MATTRFQAQTDVAGVYGTLDSLTATGVWVYALNNGDEVIQNLRSTDMLSEMFTVRAEDGTPVSLTITVTGTNDAPTATGRFRSDAVIIDSSVTGGSAVSLVGTGTDRDTGEQAALTLCMESGQRPARRHADQRGHRHRHLHRAVVARGDDAGV